MQKKFPLISLALIVILILSACGPGANANQTPQAPATGGEVVETPLVEGTPAGGAETPAAAETPAGAETPAAGETPAAEGTPAATQEVSANCENIGPDTLTLWTKEGEADGGFQFVTSLAQAFSQQNSGVSVCVVSKDVETLRQDFQTASLAGQGPDLLWTVSDHAGPFTTAGLIQPVGEMFDLSQYVEASRVVLDDQEWGVPISVGNHLMLIYNKDLVPEAPQTTDEMIEVAKGITADGTYGLVYNQTEPFWLAPVYYGYGGQFFAEDNKTPTLNNEAMQNALQFLYDLKYTHNIVPQESDYNGADALFKEGKAGMIINGDWSLGAYRDQFGDKLGIAPLPQLSDSGEWIQPLTSGVYFMIPSDVAEEKLEVIRSFIEFATNEENQLQMVRDLARLPALQTAFDAEEVTSEPVLAGSAAAMEHGTPMPVVVEMRAIWDGLKPEMLAVLTNQKQPEQAATDAQAAAEAGVRSFE